MILLMEAFDRLVKSKLFANLSEEERTAIRPIIGFLKRQRGSMVFFEGDRAEGFFVLLSGRARIFKASPDGKEFTLHHVEPGQVFAEAAIFRGPGYPANCQAIEDSEMAFVPKREFLMVLSEHPQIAMKMIGALASWLREFTHKFEELTFKEVPARLAGHLLDLSEGAASTTITLDSSKTELASMLGTVSETLSRSLKKLTLAGAIEVDGPRITILDRSVLTDIADGQKT